MLDQDARAASERRIREGGLRRPDLAAIPGGRRLAAALRRLSRLCDGPGDAWSISRAKLGNDD